MSAEDLRYTAGPAGEGECRVSLEGGLVVLRPCPRPRPGSCSCGPAIELVVDVDVALERDPATAGAWRVTHRRDGRRAGRLVDVPEPPPW
ncbi:MAG: hypothetical protein JWM10_3476 [Myxococcaceae bacterium]|nr:hypothetical protein [Myxococcaceae bacterium]